jgi:pimeloyl-ACP methyl ester carboxylesterase
MQWTDGKAMNVCCHPVWQARTRDEALAITTELFGARGENVVPPRGPVFPEPFDTAFFARPEVLRWWTDSVPDMFTYGAAGFADDRLADRDGWGTFDVARINCPVTVLHGTSDSMLPVGNAYHTAAIVPGATLRIVDGFGHMSVITKAVEVTSDLLARCTVTR